MELVAQTSRVIFHVDVHAEPSGRIQQKAGAGPLAGRLHDRWPASFTPRQGEPRRSVDMLDVSDDRDTAAWHGQCPVFECVGGKLVNDERELMRGASADHDVATADINISRKILSELPSDDFAE